MGGSCSGTYTSSIRVPPIPQTFSVGIRPSGVETHSNAILPPAPGGMPNQGSYYGLNIPLSGGKRGILGVPIFAGAIRISGDKQFVDVAYGFGTPVVPQEDLVATRISRLWINGQLAEATNQETGWASSGVVNYSVYEGSEEQLPDPRMQQWLGAGNTPAFRGITYVMFYDLPLHMFDSKDAVPVVRAELIDIISDPVQVQPYTTANGGSVTYSLNSVAVDWELMRAYVPVKVPGVGGDPDSYFVSTLDIANNVELAFQQVVNGGSPVADMEMLSSNLGEHFYLDKTTGLVYASSDSQGNNSQVIVKMDPLTGNILARSDDSNPGILDGPGSVAIHSHRTIMRGGSTSRRILLTGSIIGSHLAFYDADTLEILQVDTNDITGTGTFRAMVPGPDFPGSTAPTAIVARSTFIFRVAFIGGETPPEPAKHVPLDLIWVAPQGFTIRTVIEETYSKDLIVFFTDDSDTDIVFAARLSLIDNTNGDPPLVEAGGTIPASPLFREDWLVQIQQPPSANAFSFPSFEHGSHTGGNSLGWAIASGSGGMGILDLSTGEQTYPPFTDWRIVGEESNDGSSLFLNTEPVWFGGGFYFAIGRVGISLTDPTLPDIPAKILPYKSVGGGTALSDVLTWYTRYVGFEDSEIEINGIVDKVIGTILLQSVSFSSLVNTIGIVWDFQVFESEGKIKFSKAKKGIAFTISYDLTADTLAPQEGGEGRDPNKDAAEVMYASHREMPGVNELVYLDPALDYQVNIATAKRTGFPVSTADTDNSDTQRYEVPIIITAQEASLRVSRLLYRAWTAQTTIDFRVPPEFLTMEPVDVVRIPVGDVSYTIEVDEVTVNADHSLSVYGHSVSSEEIDEVGAQNPLELPQLLFGPSSSQAVVMDMPPVNGIDAAGQEVSALSLYSAIVSRGQAAWRSGTLFIKRDDDIGYSPLYNSAVHSGAVGTVINVPPGGPENTTDEETVLTAILTEYDANVIATITQDEFLAGGNLMAYGAPGRWEIIQARDVALVAGSQYTFSHLARGLRNTARYSWTHQAGDTLISLERRPPITLTPLASTGTLDTNVLFKAVGDLQEPDDILPASVSLSGHFERMFTPTNLQIAISGSDLLLTWDRRTRLTVQTLSDGAAPALPEEATSGNYDLEIWNDFGDADPIRTVNDIALEQYTYLNADILTDFGSVPDTLNLKLYHKSSTVGRIVPLKTQADVGAPV